MRRGVMGWFFCFFILFYLFNFCLNCWAYLIAAGRKNGSFSVRLKSEWEERAAVTRGNFSSSAVSTYYCVYFVCERLIDQYLFMTDFLVLMY